MPLEKHSQWQVYPNTSQHNACAHKIFIWPEHNIMTSALYDCKSLSENYKTVENNNLLSHTQHGWGVIENSSLMLNAHLPTGSRRYRQQPTENRRSSVGVYQTATRSSGLIGAIPPIRNLNRRKSQSALVGRCVPNVNPIVGANRQVCIEFRLDSTVGGKLTNHSYHFRARLDLAPMCASTGIDYFTHFRHFCFVVSIQPHLKHHSTSFQMQQPPLATYIIAFYGSM